MMIVSSLFLSLRPLPLFVYLADVIVQLQDVAYSGAEGGSVNVCVIADPADRAFTVTLSTTSQDTASAS